MVSVSVISSFLCVVTAANSGVDDAVLSTDDIVKQTIAHQQVMYSNHVDCVPVLPTLFPHSLSSPFPCSCGRVVLS